MYFKASFFQPTKTDICQIKHDPVITKLNSLTPKKVTSDQLEVPRFLLNVHPHICRELSPDQQDGKPHYIKGGRR